MKSNINVVSLVQTVIEDMKGMNTVTLDVRCFDSCMDFMIIATGNSQRHVKAIADKVLHSAKDNGILPIGVEGADQGEWVLVDLGEVVVHIMQEESRSFYNLEKLWATRKPTLTDSATILTA